MENDATIRNSFPNLGIKADRQLPLEIDQQ